jgi:RHS repeat-associated protein
VSYSNDIDGQLVRTSYPGGIADSLAYDNLSRVTLDRIRNGSSSAYKAIDSLLRNTSLHYDADPTRVSSALNNHGWRDTVTASYSGLGKLIALSYNRPQQVNDPELYVAWSQGTAMSATFDPLGNEYAGSLGTWGNIGWGSTMSGGGNSTAFFQATTGRVDSTRDNGGTHAFVYDSSGSTVFTYHLNPSSQVTDRASFYSADGQLRVSEARTALSSGAYPGWQVVFEEYRYDALGRRVLVMTRENCYVGSDSSAYAGCQQSLIRRTVWDGPRQLWEIQMPARAQDSALMENDTTPLSYWAGYDYLYAWADPNRMFGRLAYTYTGGVDHPLAITRINLARGQPGQATTFWTPVELFPHWNWRGQGDLGTFADGGMKTCVNASLCVRVEWPAIAFGLGLANQYSQNDDTPFGWFGTLISGSTDASGTLYQRNRYVDPLTGRFTQEDPIGLSGGVNLYGFAGGDPVTFSDPFGLASDTIRFVGPKADVLREAYERAKRVLTAAAENGAADANATLDGLNWLEQSDQVVEVVDGPKPSHASTSPDGRTVTLDYDMLSSDRIQFNVGVWMVHELGHAYTHLYQNGAWESKSNWNAINWENSIRRALGMCLRDQSHAHTPVRGCS